jgi:hypothetical protein
VPVCLLPAGGDASTDPVKEVLDARPYGCAPGLITVATATRVGVHARRCPAVPSASKRPSSTSTSTHPHPHPHPQAHVSLNPGVVHRHLERHGLHRGVPLPCLMPYAFVLHMPAHAAALRPGPQPPVRVLRSAKPLLAPRPAASCACTSALMTSSTVRARCCPALCAPASEALLRPSRLLSAGNPSARLIATVLPCPCRQLGASG